MDGLAPAMWAYLPLTVRCAGRWPFIDKPGADACPSSIRNAARLQPDCRRTVGVQHRLFGVVQVRQPQDPLGRLLLFPARSLHTARPPCRRTILHEVGEAARDRRRSVHYGLQRRAPEALLEERMCRLNSGSGPAGRRTLGVPHLQRLRPVLRGGRSAGTVEVPWPVPNRVTGR